ncbi:MAG: bifunctional homocysteine S-methyltransferase/methylenetetrahydrofolate reductase [Anaerolineaceae bacterium]|nr:bifunctional homocysteine S-methyltransferase/methylenetetrahydrofolate reductase [Anaerolineaceae bacterium]
MKKANLFERLNQHRPILMDGAMGTMLYQRGHYEEECLEGLNLTDPADVAQIHREYIEAGAEVLTCNTFGANRYKLAHHRLQDKLDEINRIGVDLAKRVAYASFKDVLVAGDVGPLGLQLYPYGRVREKEAYDAFQEQIGVLLDADVDLLILETHTNLKELVQGIKAAKDLDPEMPVVASMTFLRDDKTALGNNPEDVAIGLKEAGADVIGANCSGGPHQLQRILLKMRRQVDDLPYCIMPNAGWPERAGGRIFYPDATDYFAKQAVRFWMNGAELIGGCCGTTPAHIAAMRASLDDVPDGRHVIQVFKRELPDKVIDESQVRPTGLQKKLKNGQFVITIEVVPPHGHSTHNIKATANFYKECGVDAINVTDSPMARMRMSPWAVCNLIQNKIGIETILHFPVRGRNLLRVQGDLLAVHTTGIRNVFVVMGDPTSIGDYPEAMDDYDLVPSGLIKLLSNQFNRGVDFGGKKFSEPTSFHIGGALNLNPPKLSRELRVLNRKIESGVDFLLTQPVFDVEKFLQFRMAYEDKYGPLDVPIIAGLMPIRDAKHATFLQNEIPGITIPDCFMDRINAAGDQAAEVGLEIAMELGVALKQNVQGIYLMPFRRHQAAGKIIDAIRQE